MLSGFQEEGSVWRGSFVSVLRQNSRDHHPSCRADYEMRRRKKGKKENYRADLAATG
jgi:hypothetical protein